MLRKLITFYNNEIVRKLRADMEQQFAFPILHANKMMDKAWSNVSITTILNSFKRSGRVSSAGRKFKKTT